MEENPWIATCHWGENTRPEELVWGHIMLYPTGNDRKDMMDSQILEAASYRLSPQEHCVRMRSGHPVDEESNLETLQERAWGK
jgi:hypothetical protein